MSPTSETLRQEVADDEVTVNTLRETHWKGSPEFELNTFSRSPSKSDRMMNKEISLNYLKFSSIIIVIQKRMDLSQ